MIPGGLALIGLGIVGLARADLRKAASRGAPDRAFRASTLDRYTEMHMWGLIFAGTLGLAAGVTAGLP